MYIDGLPGRLLLDQFGRFLVVDGSFMYAPGLCLMYPVLLEAPYPLYEPYLLRLTFLLIVTGIPLAVAVPVIEHGNIIVAGIQQIEIGTAVLHGGSPLNISLTV